MSDQLSTQEQINGKLRNALLVVALSLFFAWFAYTEQDDDWAFGFFIVLTIGSGLVALGMLSEVAYRTYKLRQDSKQKEAYHKVQKRRGRTVTYKSNSDGEYLENNSK